MSMQLQSTSTVLSVSLEKTELLTAIKIEPPESEIGIDDIPNSLDDEIIPDLKDIDIVSHVLTENLIKSETVSENTFENNHSGSVKTQVFVKAENIPLIKTENITPSEYLYKTQDTSDGNVSRGTSQGVIEVQGSNEHFNVLQSGKQFVKFFEELSDISRKAKCSNKTNFSECYKTVETASCEKDKKKRKVIEVPVIPIEPHKYTSLAKAKHACNKNKSTHEQNKKRYCCEKCTFISENHLYFKQHKLSHKTKAEVDSRYLKYRCDKCKYMTRWSTNFKKHKLKHLKPEQIPYFYCYHCPYKCKVKGNLPKHIFRHFKNEDVPFHCYICDFKTLKRNLIIAHFKKHPKHHSKCDETVYRNQFETHTKKQIRYNYCKKCLYKTHHYERLKLHELTHKTEAKLDDRHFKYRCDKCKYKTFRLANFKNHKLIHLKPEEIHFFYCYHCSYKCKQKSNLPIHIFRHFEKGEVPFHCYICDFTTLKRNLIIEHFKKHPKHHSKCDETDYKNQLELPYFYCYHCPHKCKLKSNLKIHIFNHFKKEEVPFHCYICDFMTLKRNLIFEHFKKHPKHDSKCDETDYKNQLETYTMRNNYCKKCSFRTYHYEKLKLHELNHKTEAKMDDRRAKYCCDKCKYKTFRHTDFKKHKLIHLKPEEIQYFYCYHCPYKSKYKGDLKTHIFRHFKNEDVLFHCYICDFVTLKRNLIIEHFKTHPKHHSKYDETEYEYQLETCNKRYEMK